MAYVDYENNGAGGGYDTGDPPARDIWQGSPDAGAGGRPAGGIVVNDPPARAANADLPIWQQDWEPGSDHPRGAPPGQHWDPNLFSFQPDAPAAAPTGGGRMDDRTILAQIAKWASMPGADPSLGSDPNYWLGAIKSRGGLGSDNLQYWQDAGVGPTAFFRNPNRESGGAPATTAPKSGAPAAGPNPGGYTDPSSVLYLSQLMQRLSQANQPQDNSIMELLKSLALQRVEALKAPPYSAADEQALITKYRDPLTQARDAAYQRNKETASAHGYAPSSGLLRHMDTATNVGYETGIAQGANQMGVNAVALKNQNAQQQLQILSSLIAASNQQYDRGNNQADHALELAKMFPDFDAQRLDQLLRAGSDNSGSSAINSLTSLGNLNLNAIGMNNANDSANSAAWGKLIASILAGL